MAGVELRSILLDCSKPSVSCCGIRLFYYNTPPPACQVFFCIFRVFVRISPHLDFPPHMWYICITFRALCGRNPFQPDWRTVLWKESRPSRPGICVPARSMAAVGSARLPASLLARPAVALPTSSARTRRRLTGK